MPGVAKNLKQIINQYSSYDDLVKVEMQRMDVRHHQQNMQRNHLRSIFCFQLNTVFLIKSFNSLFFGITSKKFHPFQP